MKKYLTRVSLILVLASLATALSACAAHVGAGVG
jgi:hypothetical protein